jgi:hypothetical protein
MYHYAYAVDWSNAGGLTVDPYLHFPLAQFNIELLYAAVFAFHLAPYVQFVNWLFFTVTATGILALTIDMLGSANASRPLASLGGLVSSVIFISCPVVVGLMDVGYIDIPAGAMLLAFSASAVKARKDFEYYGWAIALIGGSFIGIKFSFAPSLLLFATIIFLIGRSNGCSRKGITGRLAILFIIASPWFIRNLLVAGDPLDPIINIALHRADPFWTPADLATQKADLNEPIPFWSIPIWQYLNPVASQSAISFSVCFLYVPIIGIGLLFLSKPFRDRVPEFFLLNAIIVFAMIQQFSVSNRFNRYDLHYFAVFLSYMALASWYFYQWLSTSIFQRTIRVAEYVAVLVLLVMTLPPPTPIIEYNNLRNQFSQIRNGLRYPNFYLGTIPGYNEAHDLADIMAATGTKDTVLNIGDNQNVTYFFRRKGVVSLGDNWGPGRYSDLELAARSKALPNYFNKFHIGAIMALKDSPMIQPQGGQDVLATLIGEGFREITEPESDTRAFIRPELFQEAIRNGVPTSVEDPGTYYFEDNLSTARIGRPPNSNPTPGERTAFAFSLLDNGRSVKTLTVISGYSATYDVSLRSDSILSFDIGKAFSIGTSAIGWIDVTQGSKTRRIFEKEVPVANDDGPQWEHEHLLVPFRGNVSVTFGSSSIPGGGAGDWIAFAYPRLTHATQARLSSPQNSSMTQKTQSASPAIVTTPKEARQFDAVRDFATGILSDNRPVETPNGRSALVMPVGSSERFDALTLVAPITYTFRGLHLGKGARLVGSMAYPFPSGDGATGSITIETDGQRTEELFKSDVVPTGSSIRWVPFEISLEKYSGSLVTLHFVSDIRQHTTGRAAWVSFRAKVMQNSR